ncbi:MAG: hypothetical protein WCP93_00520 [Candidatus Berkelbacteria bacterium]
MGKKNKAKFKKQNLNYIAKTQSIQENDIIDQTKSTTIEKNSSLNEMQNLAQIKSDLIKTGIIVTILALSIVAIILIDHKQNILLTFGDWIFKTLHIN